MNILNKFNLISYMENNKLSDLESIKELSLIEQHITKIEKGAFQGLKNLEKLYLNNNQTIEIEDGAFEELSQLRELYLNKNNLRVIHSSTFKGLVNLDILWLNNNRITDIDPNAFEELRNLKILYLYGNRLSKIDPNCFRSFASIALIRMHDNEFSSSIVSYYNYSLVPWEYKNSYWAFELNEVGFVADWNEFMAKIKAQAALIRPNAKWVWDNDVTSYFLNEKNSDTWTEYSKGKKTATFNFVLFDDMDPVIFDKSRNIYAKVCDRKTVFAFDSMDNFIEEKFYVFGRWHIKPMGSKLSIKISGKWVWEEEASHFLLNEKNSYVWSEYSNQNKLNEFEFILFDGTHPIIFDRSRNLYAKVKEKRLVFGKDTIESLIEEKNVENVVLGHWQIRPSTELSNPSPVPSNIEDHFLGKMFNYRYKVMRLLGKGAFGSVYLVHDQIIGPDPFKKKAMKIIDYLDLSCENELTLAIWRINHENIIRFVDHFDHRISKNANYTCIITEYCDNGDLKSKINEAKILNRHIQNEHILDWMLQATNGVRYLHSQDIIHRDIKPANMLLTKKNALKLADLGLAKVIESTVGRTYAGSPAYMSPEIFESLFSNKIYYPNTDVWSLGCVLYELITLKLAFPQGQKDNPPVPHLSDCDHFSKVLSKMFEKDAEKRIDSKKLYVEFEKL